MTPRDRRVPVDSNVRRYVGKSHQWWISGHFLRWSSLEDNHPRLERAPTAGCGGRDGAVDHGDEATDLIAIAPFESVGSARIEAFSDGVMAVIITIMVLDLRAPGGT